MPEEATTNITDEFEHYCSILKSELSYVEDGSFSWDDVVGLLVIQLKNTDSLNKARRESHATQIQLTSEREAAEGARKTEDFFPTLTLNSSFKSWRISIPARVNLLNVERLGGAAYNSTNPWRPDSIQIRRRLLNDDGQGNGNPTLQICYGDDLMPLREQLNIRQDNNEIPIISADRILLNQIIDNHKNISTYDLINSIHKTDTPWTVIFNNGSGLYYPISFDLIIKQIEH